MIARVTSLNPGVFTHFVANEQIYDRHIDNAHELLRRAENRISSETCIEVRSTPDCEEIPSDKSDPALPALILHKDPGCAFEEIAMEDFELVNYAPEKPQLRFELGI